jgi:hypothetical protein
MIQPTDLHAIWSAPDNSRLTAKQYSFRLPVHVAAKIAALCDLYPARTRTEIVGDLLATALEGVEQGLPVREGAVLHEFEDGEVLHELSGQRIDYQLLANKHYAAIEKELGNESPPELFPTPGNRTLR